MANRKVLVQDIGDGHQGYVEEGPTILLTGGATTTGHLFRGPDDPADTPAFLAILEPGDLWIDTTGTAPFSHKERNATNDGWEISAAVLKDGAGEVLAEVSIDSDGGINAAGPLGNLVLSADGSIELAQLATPLGRLGISESGIVTLQNDSGGKVEIDAVGAAMLGNLAGFMRVDAAGAMTLEVASFAVVNAAALELPAVPTPEDIADALVALGLVTQAA